MNKKSEYVLPGDSDEDEDFERYQSNDIPVFGSKQFDGGDDNSNRDAGGSYRSEEAKAQRQDSNPAATLIDFNLTAIDQPYGPIGTEALPAGGMDDLNSEMSEVTEKAKSPTKNATAETFGIDNRFDEINDDIDMIPLEDPNPASEPLSFHFQPINVAPSYDDTSPTYDKIFSAGNEDPETMERKYGTTTNDRKNDETELRFSLTNDDISSAPRDPKGAQITRFSDQNEMVENKSAGFGVDIGAERD